MSHNDESKIHARQTPLSLSFGFNDDGNEAPSPVIISRPSIISDKTEVLQSEPLQEPHPLRKSIVEYDRVSADMKKDVLKSVEIEQEEEEEINVSNAVVFDEEYSNFPIPRAPHLRYKLSRMERARLLAAGFEILLDEDKEKPFHNKVEEIDFFSTQVDIGVEIQDLRSNDVHLLFQGISFTEDFFERFGGKPNIYIKMIEAENQKQKITEFINL